MTVSEKYLSLVSEIRKVAKNCGRNPEEVSLVAVSKGHPIEHILPAYDEGARIFGENRIQEAMTKMDAGPSDIAWHLIGTLQKNKVKKAVGKFALIHSVDSLELAEKISQVSDEQGETTAILLQANTSGETSKQGLNREEWKRAFDKVLELPALAVQGLMTMAPYTEDRLVIHRCFADLRKLRDELQLAAGKNCRLKHLSMGMSHDYPIAIAEGATLVRVGTAIFG